jgi:hypothetical protein
MPRAALTADRCPKLRGFNPDRAAGQNFRHAPASVTGVIAHALARSHTTCCIRCTPPRSGGASRVDRTSNRC